MTDTKNLLEYVLHALQAIEAGDYTAVNPSNVAPKDGVEEKVIRTLQEVQRRGLAHQAALQQCVVGNYSAAIPLSGGRDAIGSLINQVFEKLRGVVRQANVIALGDYSAEIYPESEKDELGIALYRMTKTLREVAEVSVAISSGDFTRQVQSKGDQDYLAQAINQMISSLREVERQASAIAAGDYNLRITPRGERDELARSIDKMLRVIRTQLIALTESNQSLAEFAHVASHDLNAPLCKIKYCCELISGVSVGKLPKNVHQLFDVINRSCEQLLRLIGDLLDHARIDGDEAALEQVNLDQLVNESITDLGPEFEKAKASINVAPLPVILGQRTALKRLFQNLISNSLKYRSEAPLVISISAILQGKQWVLALKDNGIGIDPRDYERVFTPFVRLHTSSSIPGTGIGLANCRKVVTQMGGKIWIESQVGVGSTFFVSIPEVLGAPSEENAPPPLPGRKRILIIDDDKDQLLILRALLEKENLSITTVDSSGGGLELLQRETFDAVISDVHMPHISGAGLIRALRSHSKIPILMLTSSGSEMEAELRELGANEFCMKRDAYTRLVPLVHSLLAVSPAPQ